MQSEIHEKFNEINFGTKNKNLIILKYICELINEFFKNKFNELEKEFESLNTNKNIFEKVKISIGEKKEIAYYIQKRKNFNYYIK
jgi:hypothetical protein